jgi:hypothetical protein
VNLEPIDTSTTAGKARVMQLAAEGRRVAVRCVDPRSDWECGKDDRITWNWDRCEYAILAEVVGPDELWIVHTPNFRPHSEEEAKLLAANYGGKAVRYIRADLAGEGKP